ncbi:MAG: hypothetical protein KF901_03430 [Myxococcales bacterium]|nr:hypothetical protein [Myxococcales bacterium]
MTRTSVSGHEAVAYCGINEEQTTCEAVLALRDDWRCTGTDGRCGPEGEPEVEVPGALCRRVGASSNRCTYACTGTAQCRPSGEPGTTCGLGTPPLGEGPQWCGG